MVDFRYSVIAHAFSFPVGPRWRCFIRIEAGLSMSIYVREKLAVETHHNLLVLKIMSANRNHVDNSPVSELDVSQS